MFLKSLQISQEKTCVGVFFNKVTAPHNSNFIKKRLQHRFFSAKFAKFLKTPCFRDLQRLLLPVQGFQPATLLKKRLRQRSFFCEFYKIFKNIFWQNTSGWLLLVFIWEFREVFQNTSFIEHLISSTSYRISTTRYSKKLFNKYFSSILYKDK